VRNVILSLLQQLEKGDSVKQRECFKPESLNSGKSTGKAPSALGISRR
jgi:hypothetical protein